MSLFVPPSGTIHPLWLMHYYIVLDSSHGVGKKLGENRWAKIASCKNVMKWDVRTYGARACELFHLP